MEREFVTVDQIGVIRCNGYEAETTINWMRGDDQIHIFTSDNVTLTKIKRAMAKNPDEWICYSAGIDERGYALGYNFIAPRKAIRFVSGAARSEEQSAAASARMKARLANGWLPGQSTSLDSGLDVEED